MKKITVLVIIVFIILIAALFIYSQQTKSIEKGKTYCTPESRKGEFCPTNYDPVCGWFDAQKVQCISYPCAETYSNSCFACLDAKVEYWAKNACPEKQD